MRRLVVLAAIAFVALPFAVDAGAKEQPTVKISNPPTSLRPHMVWRATITYTVEGRPWDVQSWSPYVRVTNDRTGRIRSALAEGDLAAAGREAHAICGAAGNVGASGMERIARSLLSACKDGDAAAAAAAVRQLDVSVEQTDTALRAWLAQLPLEATAAA